jgi:hypothetical protein
MPSQKSFGRRVAPLRDTLPQRSASSEFARAEPAVEPGPVAAEMPLLPAEQSVDVDRELEEWKAARKAARRSFREPWRSLAIAATIGFGASSWLLPDAVSDIAQLLTVALFAASFFAGFRLRRPGTSSSSGTPD